MSFFKKLEQEKYSILSESLIITASWLYGTMVWILIEAIMNQWATWPTLETPSQLAGTIVWMSLWAFRHEIHKLLTLKERRSTDLIKSVANESWIQASSADGLLFISPETNLWNQRALKLISAEQFAEWMRTLRLNSVFL